MLFKFIVKAKAYIKPRQKILIEPGNFSRWITRTYLDVQIE